MFRSLIVIALSAASIGGAAAAQPDLSNTVRIKAPTADLQTPDGARKLAFRIRVAAYKVCGGDLPFGREASDFDACRQTAIRHTYEEVNAPMLAQALGLKDEVLAQSHK